MRLRQRDSCARARHTCKRAAAHLRVRPVSRGVNDPGDWPAWPDLESVPHALAPTSLVPDVVALAEPFDIRTLVLGYASQYSLDQRAARRRGERVVPEILLTPILRNSFLFSLTRRGRWGLRLRAHGCGVRLVIAGRAWSSVELDTFKERSCKERKFVRERDFSWRKFFSQILMRIFSDVKYYNEGRWCFLNNLEKKLILFGCHIVIVI